MNFDNYRTKTVQLTPTMAKEFLERRYEKQRALSENKSAEMARDILNERWNNNLHAINPIMFTPKGEMMNGQHRCLAVIIADKPIIADLMYDVPDEYFPYIDCGYARKTEQFIGMKNATVVSAVARFANAIEQGSPLATALRSGAVGHIGKRKIDPSRNEVLAYVHANEKIMAWCAEQANTISSKAFRGKGSRAGFGDAIWTIKMFDSAINNEYIEAFVRDICADIPTHPVLANGKNLALTRLIDAKGVKGSIKIQWWYGLILTMWDARYTRKKKITDTDIEKTLRKYETMFAERRTK